MTYRYVLTFLCGLGCGFILASWIVGWVRYWMGYNQGKKQMAWEIERASGMHDPVCTCVSTPGRCYWHGDMTKELLEKDKTN